MTPLRISTTRYRHPWHRLCAVALMLLLGAGALPTVAQASPNTTALPTASEDLSWSVAPGGSEKRSNFSYELDAGASRKDSFVVTNLGVKEISLAIYGADGVTSGTGALDLLPAAEPSKNIGAWVKVSKPRLTLAPGEQAEVDFTLDVPATAEPGDYVGGLVSSFADTSNGGTVLVDRRLATRMNVRVSGEGRLALEVTDLVVTPGQAWNPFAPVRATISYTVKNTGTVRARGTAQVSTSGPFGLASNTRNDAGAELIPGGSVQHEVLIEGLWPLFALTTNVQILPEGIDSTPGAQVHASATAVAIPWGQLGLLLLVVATAVVVGVARVRRRQPR